MKYGYIERERRFLLLVLPNAVSTSTHFRCINDWYLPHGTLRLREVRDAAGTVLVRKLTQKVRPAATPLTHTQTTTLYLSAAEFELMRLLGGASICKRRYNLLMAAGELGIDVFEGNLRGLVLAEMEFADDAAMQAYSGPDFLHQEVTHNPDFQGGRLAQLDAQDLKDLMSQYTQSSHPKRSS
ncbi:hypothetical protein IC235_02685 [Hymenobacter sp. BT664]|uniref:CYTH domain-containing protein n=1 Tax=Hymenobacter montanus TaxID=2771359 RepID=A0A927GI82_9BACT|nr:hypothetical protein [Hymenobacter montanus]MBD2766796.1 hypothetical protein [Hymenobacter montanus]